MRYYDITFDDFMLMSEDDVGRMLERGEFRVATRVTAWGNVQKVASLMDMVAAMSRRYPALRFLVLVEDISAYVTMQWRLDLRACSGLAIGTPVRCQDDVSTKIHLLSNVKVGTRYILIDAPDETICLKGFLSGNVDWVVLRGDDEFGTSHQVVEQIVADTQEDGVPLFFEGWGRYEPADAGSQFASTRFWTSLYGPSPTEISWMDVGVSGVHYHQVPAALRGDNDA